MASTSSASCAALSGPSGRYHSTIELILPNTRRVDVAAQGPFVAGRDQQRRHALAEGAAPGKGGSLHHGVPVQSKQQRDIGLPGHEDVHGAAQDEIEPIRCRSGLRPFLGQHALQAAQRLVQCHLQQLFLGGEVVVDRRFGQSESRRQHAHRGRVVSELVECRDGDFQHGVLVISRPAAPPFLDVRHRIASRLARVGPASEDRRVA